MNPPKFKLGDLVRKTKGSQWSGVVVGTYSTALTPEGYAVESSTEKGSVQIYPAAALEAAQQQFAHDDHMQQLQEYFQQNSMLKVYPEKPEASCCSKETISSVELESLRRKVAAASHLEFALQLVKRFAETCHCQCGKKMSDTDLPLFYTQALAWWKEANK